MAVDNDTVRKISFLARLGAEQDNIEEIKRDFNKILAWVDELNEINTEGVEPLTSVNNSSLVLRKDEITAGHNPQEILANAPAKEFDYFVVPKVME